MRLIVRNCYRKIAVGFMFSVFFVVMFTQPLLFGQSLSQLESAQNKPEILNRFMNLVDRNKEPIDDNVMSLTQTTPEYLNSNNKLHFPSLVQYLGYITDEDSALMPSLVLSNRPPNKRASIVFGVPHIRRPKQSYLQLTLYFLTTNLKETDLKDTLIIVLIAETDPIYVKNTTQMIAHQFKEYIALGVLTVISPDKSYYPDFEKQYKRQTLGDPIKRVHWRTKQNLDFAYLMMYSYSRGDYYVQLEDDVIAAPDYVSAIKKYMKNTLKYKEWFTVKFCRLGFIGQMLRTRDLPQLISFLLIFHEDQPSDWLLDDLIQVHVCSKDQDTKECRKRKSKLWLTFRNSLFQHIGYHSSLDGKVQKLKDKFFKAKDYSYFTHKDNPTAEVFTSLKSYKEHTLSKAYKGDDYFWAMEPKIGDNITFSFTPNVLLDEIVINSGNFYNPTDIMPDQTTVEILTTDSVFNTNATLTPDGYHIIGEFKNGIVKIVGLKSFGLIKELIIKINRDSQFWLILNEIHFKTISY